jgi:hypothetical protein
VLSFDHLVVPALTLDAGVAAVEAALGVTLQGGGQHVRMGTHNRLLSLGDIYLEVIAPDPTLPPPGRPRWFDMDRFHGPARPTVWVCRCEDLGAELALSPEGTGTPIPMARNGFSWSIAVPDDGILPFDNAHPALIRWEPGSPRPVDRLADLGVRLTRLTIATPHAATLRRALAGRIADSRVEIEEAPVTSMRAEVSTPAGPRQL